MIENFELNYQKELKRRRIEQSKSIKEKTYCSDKSDKKKIEIKELQKKYSISYILKFRFCEPVFVLDRL